MKKGVNNSKELWGTILILMTAIISGASIVVNKFFIVSIDPLILTATRALAIGIVFFFISLYISKSTKKKFNKVSWKYLLLIGAFGGSIAFWLFFIGLKMTMAGRAAFIHKTLPIYVAILAFIFLKEKISKKQLIAMFIMLFGLLLMQLSQLSAEIRMGDMLVLGATVLWAIESTIAKKAMMDKESNWVVVFSRMFFGSIILFAIIFLTGKSELLVALTAQQILYITISGALLFLYVLTWYWGLKYINLSKAAIMLLVAPVITLVLGVIFLGETILMLQAIGSLLILIGAFEVIWIKSEKRNEEI
ncbi:MAG: DMT family transporter [Nanoarchaeota archaeon]|nr:DMT family transporter [Nanoarchaeota archaeon]